MKKIICILVAFSLIALPAFATGTDPEESEGTKVSLWIPGVLIKFAGKMADKYSEEEVAAELIQKFGSISICIREGDKYSDKTDKKVTRKLNRLDKKNYENIITVRSDGTIVDVRVKENKKGIIKKFSIIIDEQDETFVFLKANCKIKPDEIMHLVNENLSEVIQ